MREKDLIKYPAYTPENLLLPEDKERFANSSVIGVVGPQSSGKGVVSRYLSEKFNLKVLSASSILKKFARFDGFEPPYTREILRSTYLYYAQTLGSDFMSRAAMDDLVRIWTQEHNGFILDGFRIADDIRNFRTKFNKFILIGVDAGQEQRYRWLVQRSRNDDLITRNEFERVEDLENGWVNESMSLADVVVQNNGTADSLLLDINQIVLDSGII